MKKILLTLFVVLLAAVALSYVYLQVGFPKVAAAYDIKVVPDSELVARGKYLANHVMLCMDCHGTRDWSKFSGPMVPGTAGAGGERFDQTMGFPGAFFSRNITPFGLGNWTDGEIFRAITCGVNKDGEAFFPVMPYPYYAQLDSMDIIAVIAYLRTIPSIEKAASASAPDFPFNLILRTIPKQATLKPRPSPDDKLAYGKYVFTAAGCPECHTPAEKGQILTDKLLGGGREFNLGPMGTLISPNISSDKEAGIGNWSKEAFVARFKTYDMDSGFVPMSIKAGDMQTIMPWTMYAGMTEEDLVAIYDYIQSLPPQHHVVANTFTAAKH